MTPFEAVRQSGLDPALFASGECLKEKMNLCPEWTPEKVRSMALYCRFPEDAADRLAAFTEQYVYGNELFSGLLNAAFITLYFSPVSCPDIVCDLNIPHSRDYARVLLTAAMAHVLPPLHRAWGIPEAVTHDTCQQAAIYWRNAWNDLKIDTVYFGQLCWLKWYAVESCRFVRLGRLEFQMEKHTGFRVWKNSASGKLFYFAGDKVPVDKSGFGVKDPDDPLFDHATSYAESETEISGHLVRKDGSAGEFVTLPKKDCECLLKDGDPVLEVHFPAGGGMSPELVRDSFRQASEFFKGRFNAFVTGSWVCNPNLKDFMPPESNLIQFQNMVQLMPSASPEDDGLWFIFRDKFALPPEQRPQDTNLQRSVLKYIVSGHRWRTGKMVLFP